MKSLLFVLVVTLSFFLPAKGVAAPKWVRRLSAAAVCGAAALDLATTSYGIAHGGHELNSNFINNRGNVQWGQMIGVNVAMCGTAIALSEFRRTPEKVAIAANGAFTVTKALAVTHNLSAMGSLK